MGKGLLLGISACVFVFSFSSFAVEPQVRNTNGPEISDEHIEGAWNLALQAAFTEDYVSLLNSIAKKTTGRSFQSRDIWEFIYNAANTKDQISSVSSGDLSTAGRLGQYLVDSKKIEVTDKLVEKASESEDGKIALAETLLHEIGHAVICNNITNIIGEEGAHHHDAGLDAGNLLPLVVAASSKMNPSSDAAVKVRALASFLGLKWQ